MRDRLALTLLALATYVWLAPAHIVAGDNAEFATLGALGGGAHPSGYPLYVLYLRATSWLPGASPAHTASIATALLGAAMVFVLHAACRAWGARAQAATFATAIIAAAPLVLRVHTEADVFALNSLVASAILWLAAPGGPVRGVRRAALLGLVAGLGLANNLTCALLAPIGIYGVVRGVREAESRVAPVLAALGAFAVGLLPYAYLFIAPDAASWAPVHSLGDLLDTILRKDYGYTSHLPGRSGVPLATSLSWHALLVARCWLWVPAIAGVAALGVRCVRGADRAAWACLAASWLLAGPLLASQLGVDPHGVGGYIGGRMQILSAVVLAVPVAIAFETVAARASRALSVRAATALAAAAFVGLTALALPRLARVHGPTVEAAERNLLGALPPAAIAIVVSEDHCFGARYLQLAQGARPDVTVVCWALATRAWYRERLAGQGVALAPTAGGPLPVAQAEALLATGRPLLVEPGTQPQLFGVLPSYPVGMLIRVLPRAAAAPSLGEIVRAERAAFERFDLDDLRPGPDDDFAAAAHARYAAIWRTFARALDAAGDREQAEAARGLALQLAPG